MRELILFTLYILRFTLIKIIIMSKKIPNLTWTEIDSKAVAHNLKAIRGAAMKNQFFIPTRNKPLRKQAIATQILAVVKSNAYGHGMVRLSKLLDKSGVGFFGVSNIFEGRELRQVIKKKPILVFESTLCDYINDLIECQLMPTVGNIDFARKLNQAAKKKKCIVDIHVKVDTGMGRLGVWIDDAYAFIVELYQLTHLRIMGIYTHFPVADTDRAFTKKQVESLYQLVLSLDKKGYVIPYIHAANSMGLAGYQTKVLNVARPGLMLYGLYPSVALKKKLKLKPALSVYSKVIFLKDIAAGRGISYGHTFIAKKKMKIAVIPIGYNDGYMRSMSNKAFVLIAGRRCRVVGNITMNQIMVDVSHIKNVLIGDKVTLLGAQGQAQVSADDLAKWAGSIHYEMVCSLGNRLENIVI